MDDLANREYDIEIIPPTRWQRRIRFWRAMMPHYFRLVFDPMYRQLWKMMKDAS